MTVVLCDLSVSAEDPAVIIGNITAGGHLQQGAARNLHLQTSQSNNLKPCCLPYNWSLSLTILRLSELHMLTSNSIQGGGGNILQTCLF